MGYRFHEDIVYTRVCDIPLLVTLRNSWDKFPALKRLSPFQGCFCQGIEWGMSEEEIIGSMELPKKIKREKVRELYRAFVLKMLNEGYLIQEENEVES